MVTWCWLAASLMYRLLSHTCRNMYCGHMHMYVTVDDFTVVSLAKDIVAIRQSGNLLLSKQVKVNILQFTCESIHVLTDTKQSPICLVMFVNLWFHVSVMFSHVIMMLLCFIIQVGVVTENSIPVVTHPNTSFSNYEMNKSLPPTCNSNSSGHHSRSSSDENALYEPERSAILTGLSHNSDNAGKEWKSCSYSASLVICNQSLLFTMNFIIILQDGGPLVVLVCSLTSCYSLFLGADDLWWSIHMLQMYC